MGRVVNSAEANFLYLPLPGYGGFKKKNTLQKLRPL